MMSICIILFKTYFAFASTAGSIVCSAFYLLEVNGGDVVGIDFLPAVEVIEQSGRGTLRAHQGCFDPVFLKQPEQVFRFHQPAGGVVVDKEFFDHNAASGLMEPEN